MAKTRRRRMRQKKTLEAESSITDSCDETSVWSVKPLTKPSRLRQSHKKGANSFSSENPSQNPTVAECDSKCGEICYNAVICHSFEDGEIALNVKTWLEQNILLQTGRSKRAPKVELIGKISPNYAASLEIASKRTKTIIILCTKRFCHDAKFKKATHALWTWEADETDLQVFPLFFGFEEGDSLPECISVKDAHALHFKKDSEYFRYIMRERLFLSGVEHLQHEDNSKGKQNEGKAGQDRHQQGQDDKILVRSSRDIRNDCRLGSHGEIGTDEQVVHDSGADNWDSGVGSSVTALSVPMPMSSTNGWSSQPQSSLSGPAGLPPDPYCAQDSQMDVNTMTSQILSTNLPGTSLANIREEVSECACSEENQVSHKDESDTLIKDTLCSQTPSIPAENPLSDDTSTSALCTAENLQRASTSLNSCASLRVQNRPKLKENLESNICTEKHVTHLLPDPRSGVGEICDQNSLMMQGKPSVTEDTDVQTDGLQLCASASNSESNLVGSKSNNSLKPSRKDRRKELQDIPTEDGYLTPVACPMPCRHRLEAGDSDARDEPSADGSEDQKLLDSGSFELNNTILCVNMNPLVSRDETAEIRSTETHKPHEIKAERQKMLLAPATLPPPSHRYINSTARMNHPDDSTRTKRLSSMVQSQPSTMTVCNPVPKSKEAVVSEWDDDEFATTDSATNSSATWCQLGTVNIHNAASVNFYGASGCQIFKEGQLLPILNSEKSSDALTTYQTWPFIDNGRNQARGPSEAPSPAHSRRVDSRGPQPPPRRGHDQTKDVFRPSAREGVPSSKARTKKTPYAAILSGLGVFLTCCRRKKREKARNTEVWAHEMSPDTEDPYDYIPDSTDLDTPTVFSK